jgi:hypothetical protein
MVKTVDTRHILLSSSSTELLLHTVMESNSLANMVSQAHLVVQLMESVALVPHSSVVLGGLSLVTSLVAVPSARSEDL